MTIPKRLADMLTYRRPAGSKTEANFIKRFIAPYEPYVDGAGNHIIDIATSDGLSSEVLWSSHTDTVHRAEGRQTIRVSPEGIVSVVQQNCLGADCTVGVWIMLEMIDAKVPGLYVFHAGEEIGGVGSSYIADQAPGAIQGIKYAIAFDRKGTNSIITHQFGRCCSNDFADSLKPMLPPGYVRDAGGVFTDTANYTGIVPECTNLSVGYFNEHTSRETLDLNHAILLRDTLIAQFDESKLVAVRDPKVVEIGGRNRWTDYYDFDDSHDLKFSDLPFGNDDENLSDDLLEAVRNHPYHAAELLKAYGVSADEIYSAVYSDRRL